MGSFGNAVGKLVSGVLSPVTSLLGGGSSGSTTVNIPTVETPAQAVSTPESTPTEQAASNDLTRKKRGKAALTIPTSNQGTGSGGTGISI